MNQLLQHSGTCEHSTSERRATGADPAGDCATEPHGLTYPRARAILHAHDRHMTCRQWIAAAAYLSAGLDDE
ncbi:hypothetical protein [Nocardia spumae]|uniref:hypothetical protein n=1 Tax=Nocardia spumae TaxID=2887190 RepID=UPI001D1597BF|nr:hypothetical protein [Nocardia spumae]